MKSEIYIIYFKLAYTFAMWELEAENRLFICFCKETLGASSSSFQQRNAPLLENMRFWESAFGLFRTILKIIGRHSVSKPVKKAFFNIMQAFR